MSNVKENTVLVIAIVEGQTEQKFIESVLSGYLATKNIFISAIIMSKKGQKGGDVKFSRAKNDIRNFLKQGYYSCVTTFFDYYATKEWPGIDTIIANSTPSQIAKKINNATTAQLIEEFPDIGVDNRFIPFIAVHEFEALLFSDSQILAEGLGVSTVLIQDILEKCNEPEAINSSPQTAPSKRLEAICCNFKKTVTGIAIANSIGIDKMREKCPNFNTWLLSLEALQKSG